MKKRALITGITGQDGSYLAELLLEQGYDVHGIIRRSSSINTGRIAHLYKDSHDPDCRLFLHYGDLQDSSSLARLLDQVDPHEVYNLGAQSHVRVSFDSPLYTADATGMGCLRLLEAIRDTGKSRQIRFYQAGSSEMFGDAAAPQHERTVFQPRSPYACAKVFAHYATINYREAYGLHASNGILFNHESPRRGDTFVTQKIARAVVAIARGEQDHLFLGHLDAKRDWGFAGDYVEAMWLMLQQTNPDDYVIATGQSYTVRDFLDHAFAYFNLDWHDYVKIDPRYFRPTEVPELRGIATKAHERLGWAPRVAFPQLVHMMVEAAAGKIKS